jgi:hypothetical protein
MSRQKDVFWNVIKVFADEGVLPYVILVGSWAEVVYEAVYNEFDSSLYTNDVDFLVPNINLPRDSIDVISILEENGFVPDSDPLTGANKFYCEGVLELEFLVKEMGSGQLEPYFISSMGLRAQGLRNMNILADYTFSVLVNGNEIFVPIPEAYILEKLMINKYRKDKKEKDIRAVQRLLEVLRHSGGLEKLEEIYNELTAKQRKAVDETCNEVGIVLFL